MPKFPTVSSNQFIKFLKEHGFRKIRHDKSSHIILTREGIKRPLVIPYDKELSIGVVQNNLKTAGIPKTDFIAAMQKSKKS